jgi:hypothetical protein
MVTVLKEFSALQDNIHNYMCVFCINYYSRCHGNAVKGFLGLAVCMTYSKTTVSYSRKTRKGLV